ncbi:MAG TPA: hypothetical protein P5293_00925 [Bacteroidales bacterium]|nr:hypothetical protein [Bacteroidales bacterium]
MKISFTKRYEKDKDSGKQYPIMIANIEFSMEELERLKIADDRLSRTISKSLLRLFNEMEFGTVENDPVEDVNINIARENDNL